MKLDVEVEAFIWRRLLAELFKQFWAMVDMKHEIELIGSSWDAGW